MDIGGNVKMQKTVFFWLPAFEDCFRAWALKGPNGREEGMLTSSEIEAVEAAQEELSTCRALFQENQESIKCLEGIHPTYPNILKGTLFFEGCIPGPSHA